VENDSSVTTVNAIDNWWAAQRAQNATNLNGTLRRDGERERFAGTHRPQWDPRRRHRCTDAGNCEVGAVRDRLRVESSTVGGTIDVGPDL